MKTPRFLLSEDPTNQDERTYITCARPLALIEVVHEPEEVFTRRTTDFVLSKPYSLETIHLFIRKPKPERCAADPERAAFWSETLDDAWQWYKSYLQFEDQAFDDMEQSRLN